MRHLVVPVLASAGIFALAAFFGGTAQEKRTTAQRILLRSVVRQEDGGRKGRVTRYF
jgi:hypothetical protein